MATSLIFGPHDPHEQKLPKQHPSYNIMWPQRRKSTLSKTNRRIWTNKALFQSLSLPTHKLDNREEDNQYFPASTKRLNIVERKQEPLIPDFYMPNR